MKHGKFHMSMANKASKKTMARRGTPGRPMSGGMGGSLVSRAAKAARKGGPGARGIAKRLTSRGK